MVLARPYLIGAPWKALVSQLLSEEAQVRRVLETESFILGADTIRGPGPTDELLVRKTYVRMRYD